MNRPNQIHLATFTPPTAVALPFGHSLSKTLFDGLVAAAGLVVLAPLMLAIALLVKLTSRGPVLYRQIRVGLNNQTFTMYKFRSMRADAERGGVQWARANDSRVTPIGQFLRRTHLDELPQLFNVLKGEMSLVGPRPERPVFVGALSRQIDGYALRHCVKPGITGLAQIHHHADRTVDDVRIKLAYDLHYLETAGLMLDLWILGETCWIVSTGCTLEETRAVELVERMA